MRALAVLLLFSSAAYAEISKDTLFQRANEAYMTGRYTDAIDAYEQVVPNGVRHEDLFYNLGNAYQKAGRLGAAIYNYERALELDPDQDDVQFNLKAARQAARSLGEDRLVGAEGTPFWMRMVQPFTLGMLGWVFLALWLTVFTILISLRFVQPGFLRVGLWAGFAFLCAGTLVGGVMFGTRYYLAERVEQAVVLPDSAQVKDGPDANYQTSFNVHAGLRVRITERDQEWVRVRLSNGLEGWLRERDLGRL